MIDPDRPTAKLSRDLVDRLEHRARQQAQCGIYTDIGLLREAAAELGDLRADNETLRGIIRGRELQLAALRAKLERVEAVAVGWAEKGGHWTVNCKHAAERLHDAIADEPEGSGEGL